MTDEKQRPDTGVVELHEQIARLLGHPAPIRICRDPGEVDATSREFDEERDVEPPQEERVVMLFEQSV